jgi:hydroxypyruvate reductase/glycerate 2-kinase
MKTPLKMYLKNFSQLTPNSIRKELLALRRIGLNTLEIALSSVEPKKLIQDAVKIVDDTLIIQNDVFDLRSFRHILVIGGGKASVQMALALEELLKEYSKINYNGLINVLSNLELNDHTTSNKIKMNPASHPIPDNGGFNGTKTMYTHIENTNKDDLVIFLLSGGGSALLPKPKQSLSLKDLQLTNSLLIASGASIREINTVRKHLSDFKGGKLAKKVYESSGAKVIAFIISDVVGDNLETIASGPTIPDSTTFKDAYEVLRKYQLLLEVPISVKQLIENGMKDSKLNVPLNNPTYFENVHNYLIGSIKSAVNRITDYLRELGFIVDCFSNKIVGEAAIFGEELYDMISSKLSSILKNSKEKKIALIGTGELTVTIKGKGIGGRNQEMLLNFLNNIKDKNIGYLFLTLGVNLDGIEGNSNAMGAIVDNVILTQLVNQNMNLEDFIKNNDSNSFFKQMNAEIITGPTGLNVNDLLLILIELND